VGVVWQVGDWDQYRSIPFSLLAPLADIPGIRLYILQSGAREAGWQEGVGVYPGELSLVAYAGLLRSLDLLISVDTMAVHLAGALGVPVWTLLHAEANWRWMEDRDDSPWYPTMRLFRQQQPNDWQDVIRRVKTALQELSKQ
jgi:ADP-heptose:LPS heptosyltransferase